MNREWRVFRGDLKPYRTHPWVALHVNHKFAIFPTWREAFDYADREARR